jgi:REP-associated tyrosine transposase
MNMGSTYSQLHFHIIFGVKERRALINTTMRERLHQYIGGIVRKEGGVLQAIGGSSDHIHLLLALPPAKNAADIVRVVKSNSSKWIHEEFPQMKIFSWQVGYSAFSVSHSNVEAVKDYIENQEEHHQKMSFSEEWKAILEKHGIVIDE